MAGIEAGFSALEWAVISLARRDRLASLDRPGAIVLVLGTLFGAVRLPRLADPRLEALRRMAVHAHHHRLPIAEIRRFLSAGFRTPQLRTLVAIVAAARIDHHRHA